MSKQTEQPMSTPIVSEEPVTELTQEPVTEEDLSTQESKSSIKSKQSLSNAVNEFKKWISLTGLSEKKHQIEGIKWCLSRELNLLNGIRGGLVADEMGLGKTILMLGLIISNFKPGGTIIIVPPALLSQWSKEIERLFGHSPATYHGKTLKDVRSRLENGEKLPIVITTYGIIMSRKKEDVIFQNTWFRMICDEAHHMRNKKSKLFLKMKYVKAEIKWLSTGTPIQNKATDLLSLCKVLGLDKEMEKTPSLTKNIILAHSLRRTKKDTDIELPPIKYHTIDVPWLSDKEQDFAADIHSQLAFPKVTRLSVSRAVSFLGGSSPLPWLTRARQVCIFPHLLNKSVKTLIDEGVVDESCDLRNIKTTSKITSIVRKITERKNNRRRKLVFCHYSGEIDLLEALLKNQGISTVIIDGRQSTKEKKFATTRLITEQSFRTVCKKWSSTNFAYRLISDFMAPDVCLCQIQTCSEGLNLQHFQEIYFSSPWWNPALEDQAVARAHRIGQEQPVDVFRFVLENFGDDSKSLDQYCIEVQNMKRDISNKYLRASEKKADAVLDIKYNKRSFRFEI